MNKLRRALQHLLNPLHLYCRLRDFGVGTGKAQRMCGAYERIVYRLFSP
jgi:hypothetical protein